MNDAGLRLGWRTSTLAELCTLNPRDEHPHDGTEVSFVPMAAVSELDGTISTPTIRKVADVKKGFTSFQDGDVIFAKITPCMENGKSAVAKNLVNGRGYGSTEFFVLRSKGTIEPSFLHRFMRQTSYRQAARQTMQSGVGQARVPKDFIEGTSIDVPPLAEQRRIVARLDALQAHSRAAREALADVPALLDTFRQSVLAAAFRGDLTADWRAKNPDVEPASVLLERIRKERRRGWEAANPRKTYVEPAPVDTDGLPELPEGWGWVRLEQLVANITYGFTASASDDSTGRKFLRITDLADDGVDWDDVPYCEAPDTDRYDLKTGDIVVARTGATTGKSYRLVNPPLGAVFASYLIRLEALTACPSEYLAMFMKGPSYWSQITMLSKGTAQPGANATVLGGIVVPVCSLAEMEQIRKKSTEVLNRQGQIIAERNAACDELNSIESSILARAFRGELVSQDPADEPAEQLLARIAAQTAAAPAKKTRTRSVPA